uniref:PfkB family carbohydrate kinase n=1 Tax=uncultured Bifidobacterium sp. TaxID=165187 RepID=UPI0026355B97
MQFDLVVLGSINLDVKALITTYPKHGDTATAKSITMLPGGKGSNQAVAAAKLGGKVAMLGAVGEDGAGKQMLDNLKEWDVDTRFVMRNPDEGTGTFVVQVDQTSENTMVGTLGANDTIKGTEVTQALVELKLPSYCFSWKLAGNRYWLHCRQGNNRECTSFWIPLLPTVSSRNRSLMPTA